MVADAQTLLGTGSRLGRVNNPNTAFATIAVPPAHPKTLWIAWKPVAAAGLQVFDLRLGARF